MAGGEELWQVLDVGRRGTAGAHDKRSQKKCMPVVRKAREENRTSGSEKAYDS